MTLNTQPISVIDACVIFHVDFRIWSGRRRLKADDFKHQSDLPPAELASLGSKRICNPEALNPFHKLRKQAETECLRKGTRFLGGYAVPKGDEAVRVSRELERIVAEANQAKQQFIKEYDAEIKDWIDQHPAWSGIIREAILTSDQVAARLFFNFVPMSISNAESLSDDGMKTASAGITDQMLKEVAQVAAKLWEDSISGKDRLTQHTVRPFKHMREKLLAWTYVDPRVEPLADSIDLLLSHLPPAGPITDQNSITAMSNLALILSDVDRSLSHGQRMLDGMSMEQALFGRMSAVKTDAEVAQVVEVPALFNTEHQPAESFAFTESEVEEIGRIETQINVVHAVQQEDLGVQSFLLF